MKKVIIAGGTGHLGSSLSQRLVEWGYQVQVLTRKKVTRSEDGVEYVLWDGETWGSWSDCINHADTVINLCGMSVNCRYTASNKLKLIHSRVRSTEVLGHAIRNADCPPRIWINASSSAYYGFSSVMLDEDAPPGGDFPARICAEWEKSFYGTETPHTRKVAWRLGIVLQREKGLIIPFANLVKRFVGGKLGSGEQYFTWIHEEDFLNAALWTIDNASSSGVYNITSPKPVTNNDFMRALRRAMGVSIYFPLPEWMLKVGGKIIGTEPYLILKGRRIIPARLSASGFTFQYADINSALMNLYQN